MVHKGYSGLNRSVQDMSRPAVFVNKSQNKDKLEKQTPKNEKAPQK